MHVSDPPLLSPIILPYSSPSHVLPPFKTLEDVANHTPEGSSVVPTRRSSGSAWPGFPGPEKDILTRSLSSPSVPPLRTRPESKFWAGHSVKPLPVLAESTWYTNIQSHGESSSLHSTAVCHHMNPFAGRPHSKLDKDVPRQSQGQEYSRLSPISSLAAEPSHCFNRDVLPPISVTRQDRACAHCTMEEKIENGRRMALSQIYSPSCHARRRQIPTPLPPSHGHTMISFQPLGSDTPSEEHAFGVSMADVLNFQPCLADPDAEVLDEQVAQIFLTLEAKGYSTYMQEIPVKCTHRRISRFSLAYAVASKFDAYLKDFPFNPAAVKPASIVVRSVDELRMVNLYTRDGRVWRVHVAYHD